MSMRKLVRIVIKLLLSFVVVVLYGGASAFARAVGAGGLVMLIISLGALGALTGIYRYKPKAPETELDKTL